MATVLYPGSFDPIHNAHLIAAQLARESLGLDVVRLMVAAQQPHKLGGHEATAEQRAEMVELAVAGLPGLVADWREPNVIRVAPVPMYNSFEDVWRFGQILKAALS